MKYRILLMLLFLFACQPRVRPQVDTIVLKGSDTMFLLAQQWAEAYMVSHPNTVVLVEGGGSATGFEALINGETDIALASRLITPQEARKMAETYKSIGISFMVAKDALSVYLNKENQVLNLTLGDLALIFSGHISNWLVFTDKTNPVLPVIRPQSSGTHLFFKKHVLKNRPYGQDVQRFHTTNDIISFISSNINAIGYGGFAYGDSVFHAPVNGVFPTEENVRNGRYPLTRYLYLYTIDTPPAHVRRFIDWIISPAGQRIVKQIGYFPLWDE